MENLSDKECFHKIPGLYYYEGMALYDATPRWTIEPVKQFRFRKEDVLIAAYPKCGTSFIQEIVFLIENNVDVKATDKVPSFMRVPYMELVASPEEHETKKLKALEMLENVQEGNGRLMKSHFPVNFYLDQIRSTEMKVVLAVRNVKDVLVSFYHFYRMNKALGNFAGTWDDFFTMFENKQLLYGDYLDWLLPWWNAAKAHSNIHVVKFEDIKSDPKEEINKLCAFLGRILTEDQINTIIRTTDFQEMASKSTTNYSQLPIFDFNISPFMRKGCVGDWKNYFTKQQNDKVDRLFNDALSGTGLEFKYMP